MNAHALTNYGIIRSFHDQGKSIITAFIPLVEYGLSIIQKEKKEYYDVKSLNDIIVRDCGFKIPALTMKNILSKLHKERIINLYSKKQYFLIINSQKITAKEYFEKIYSAERNIKKFITKYKEFSAARKTDEEIREEIYEFISSRRLMRESVKNTTFVKFLENIYQQDDYLVKIYQDINFGYTLCSLLEQEEELENIKLKDLVIYLDSNFVLRLLDLQEACYTLETTELFELLKKSGAKLKIFQETVNEVKNVIDYYKHLYINHKSVVTDIFDASMINGVFGALFRRRLTISEIDNIIDGIDGKIEELGIGLDKISRYKISIQQDAIADLYLQKYGKKPDNEEEYRYNKCRNYVSIISIIKLLRTNNNVYARCFGNCKFVFLTCDWKLYRYNLKRPHGITYSEILVQEAIVDNLILYFPDQYLKLSTDLIVSVYQSSNYLNVHDLDEISENITTIIKEDPDLTSYVSKATSNIENYSEITQLYSEDEKKDSQSKIEGLKQIIEKQKSIDAANESQKQKRFELETQESFSLGRKLGQNERENEIKDSLKKHAKTISQRRKIIKIIACSLLFIAPIILIVLLLCQVIKIDETILSSTVQWCITSLMSVICFAGSILLKLLWPSDEKVIFKKLCDKFNLAFNE